MISSQETYNEEKVLPLSKPNTHFILSGKSKSKATKPKGTTKDKENICQDNRTITEYFKTEKPKSTASAKKSTVLGRMINEDKQLKEKKEKQTRGIDFLKSTKRYSGKDLRQYEEFPSDVESNDDDVHSESDERELSLIIDRILNMDMNGWSKQSCRTKTSKQGNVVSKGESKEFKVREDLRGISGGVRKAGEESKNNESEKNIALPQTPSLFERASKRLSQNKKEQLEFLQKNVTSGETSLSSPDNSLCESTDRKSISPKNLHSSITENKFDTYAEDYVERRFYEIQTETSQSPDVDSKRQEQSHSVSKDMFEDSLGDDTLARIFDDTMTENSILDTSLPDLNQDHPVTNDKVTGHKPDLTSNCDSRDSDKQVFSVASETHLHESTNSIGNTALPVSVESWCLNKFSVQENTKLTLSQDVNDYDDAFNESYMQDDEALKGSTCYNMDEFNESNDVLASHKCTPQQSVEKNLCQTSQPYSLTQFCANEVKKGNRDETEKPPISTNQSPSRPDSKAWPVDLFSPAVTLPLAQRLRLKCSDKRYRKLLDDLG